MIKIEKIKLHNFRFFVDDEEHNSFDINGKNMLVYGENGSGKSSLYKAFELLANPNISEEEFAQSINIFKQDDTYLQFEFNNDEILRIDSDHLSLENQYPFIEKLSISKPIMDYKSLLSITYSTKKEDKKNLYAFFEKILSQYPITEDVTLNDLKEREDNNYFSTFEHILKEELFDDINIFLGQFGQSFQLTEINFNFGFNKVNLEIEYFDEKITEYHLFLNEARLSALAMSIYFSIIKAQFRLLGEHSLKILVLDDLLISLDMSNRLTLIEILKNEFSDFQIFLFTHDKGFFEVLKDKMSWKAFELYVNRDENGHEVPFIKKSLNYFESAKKHFDEYDYPACANYLRKEVERIKKIVNESEIDGIPVDRSMQIVKRLVNSDDFTNFSRPDTTDEACIGSIRGKLIGIQRNLENAREPSVEINMQEVHGILHRILHPQSHDDTSRPLYKKELEEAIAVINDLRENLENPVAEAVVAE